MKCSKCNFENVAEAQFCANCGNNLAKKKTVFSNKKVLLGCGVLGVFLIVIIVVIVLNNQNDSFTDPFESVDDIVITDTIDDTTKEYEMVNSFVKNIESDYNKGLITTDEYIEQLAYSIFDKNLLDYKYSSLNLDFNKPSELFAKAFANYEELSDETLLYVFEKYTLADVTWEVEEATTSSNNSSNYQVTPLVSPNADVSKLDNVVMSSNNNFLVYYTEDGANAITSSEAEKIADFLEEVVVAYEEEFGLEYNYRSEYSFFFDEGANSCEAGNSLGNACRLLRKNNIDPMYLNTAMPVYIIDTNSSETNALGYYVPPFGTLAEVVLKISDITKDLGTVIDNIISTYTSPFFVVSSSLDDFDDTKIILAHELFHHYQNYICGDGSYSECSSSNFTTETNADFAASTILDIKSTKTAINGHSSIFVSDITSSLDKVGFEEYGDTGIGYGAFVFAHNYASLVPDGANKLFESMKYEDTLKYLYDNSSGKYKDALLETAEKTLTLDYDNKLLIASQKGKILFPSNYEDIPRTDYSKTNRTNYSSMHYYYLDPEDYEESASLTFTGNSDDLTLLLFIRENNAYEYLYTYTLNEDFTINIDDFSNYQEIAIAIVNSSITSSLSYYLEIDNSGAKIPTVTAEDLGLISLKDIVDDYSSFVCYTVQEDEEYNSITQIKIDFNDANNITDLYVKATLKLNDYNPDNPAFAIAQKVADAALYAVQKMYEEQFKHFKIITKSEEDKYSVTFKITDDFYEALNNSLSINSEDKYSIIKDIQSEGYICKYS